MKKTFSILLNAIPIIIMIGLIPFVTNDYILTIIYIAIIATALRIKRAKGDFTVLFFGFFIMIAVEYLFTNTGVEKFNRNSLFGLIPLWLPFLWAYGFIAIKRSIEILNS